MPLNRTISVRSFALAVLLLLASTSALAVGAAGIDRLAIQSGPAIVATAPNSTASAQLNTSIVTVRRGAATTVAVTLENTTNATIVVGGEGSDYNLTITITDINGDGVVPLRFRTGSVGMDATRFVPANDVDEYGTLNAAPDPDGRMPVGKYPIAVYVGHGLGGTPSDIGTVTVTAATPSPTASIQHTGSVLTLRPQSDQTITGTTDLNAGREITVRLTASGASPFIKTERTTIREDGAFSATFDLREIDPPANATATVHVDGTQIAGPVPVDIVARASTTTRPEATTRTPQPTTGAPLTRTPSSRTPTQVPGFGMFVAVIALGAAVAIGRFYRG